MKKKAMMDTFKHTGMAVVVLIAVLLVLLKMVPLLQSAPQETECGSYIRLASTVKQPITRKSLVDLGAVCPTQELIVKPRGYNDEEINANAADDILTKMYQCGKTWGLDRGKVLRNPFDQWGLDNVCVVCSNITFPGFPLKEVSGIFERQTSIIPGEKISFYEFFTGNTPTPDIVAKLKENDQQSLDTSKKYYVIYSVDMETSEQSYWTWLGLSTTAGAGAGFVATKVISPVLTVVSLVSSKAKLVKSAIIGIGIIVGVKYGDEIGENRRDISTAKIMVVDPDEIKQVCQVLGKDPYGPWVD